MNPKSIIFLLILLCVVLFFVGINLGKTIEKINKTQPPITPIIKAIPSLSPAPLLFNTFNSKECGLSFLYPDTLEPKSISSNSSMLASKNKDMVSLSCESVDIKDYLSEISDLKPAQDIIVNSRTVHVYDIKGQNVFEITSSLTGKNTVFNVSPNLTDLVAQTLTFTPIQTPSFKPSPTESP
jgi:hypothetical protein